MQSDTREETAAIAEDGYTIEKVKTNKDLLITYRYRIKETNTFFTSQDPRPLEAYKRYFHITPGIKYDDKVIIRCLETPPSHFVYDPWRVKYPHKFYILETDTYYDSDTDHIIDGYRKFCSRRHGTRNSGRCSGDAGHSPSPPGPASPGGRRGNISLGLLLGVGKDADH